MPRNDRPRTTISTPAATSLFEEVPLPTAEFIRDFQRLLEGTLSSHRVDASRNRGLETLIRRQTGWRTVGVKVSTAAKNIKNRISEIGNRADDPANAVIVAPRALVADVVRLGTPRVASGDFNTLSVIAMDATPPSMIELIARRAEHVPQALRDAFPQIRVRLIADAPDDIVDVPEDTDETRQAGLSLDEFVTQTNVDRATAETWLRRLQRKKHLVFQGPPGTGKTFIAKRLARVQASNIGRIETVQFHPSYSYEDFVQGIRPAVVNGVLNYSLEPGLFVRFCEAAGEHIDVPHVLIIDEMNRGNLSKIFGELLFLLEYREESIPLAQGKKRFSVPRNVYLIATMNTADRSIALVDHALRRRFSFVHLGPDYDGLTRMLERHGFDSEQLVQVLRRANDTIGDRHYHLGTSFFLGAGPDLRTELREIWQGEIEPYLEEYFFDQPTRVDEFKWEHLVMGDLSWWAIPTA